MERKTHIRLFKEIQYTRIVDSSTFLLYSFKGDVILEGLCQLTTPRGGRS
jgi:hypothetical protein